MEEPTIVTNRARAIQVLTLLLQDIAREIETGAIPSIKIRSRTKSNLIYDQIQKVWKLGDKTTLKTAKTMGGSKELLKILNLLVYILEQLEQGKTSTCRQLYYVALSWIQESRFEQVSDSNTALENLQILSGLLRQELGIVPQISGSVFGPLVVKTRTRAGQKIVDCSKDVSQAGFPIPPKMQDYSIQDCKAKFMMVIETGGMYQRLIQDRFDQTYGCLLVHTHGQPSRATRIMIKRVSQLYDIPILAFTDGDPWGVGIAYNINSGSIKSVHLSDRLCTPRLIHIGLTSTQIQEYKLPTDKLTPRELQRVDQMMEDPRYQREQQVMRQLNHMKSRKVKAEQQALAIRGLSYVTEVYLPQVLAKYKIYPLTK